MSNYSIEIGEALESLDTYTRRTILIKIVYFLLGGIIHIRFFAIPSAVFISIFLMIAYAIAVSFFARRYITDPKAIINSLFLLVALDLLLITIIINFLGVILYITYTFYIILAFMTLPRSRAIYLVTWIVLLYLGLILLQYFQIFQPLQLLPPEEMSPQNFTYVFTVSALYFITLLLLSVRCFDFYQVINRRINALQKVRLSLEEEKVSLEIKIQARKTELEEQKEGLARKVKERKKELERENRKLEERAQELVKFRKVVLDREIKMGELKKQLENLKSKTKGHLK